MHQICWWQAQLKVQRMSSLRQQPNRVGISIRFENNTILPQFSLLFYNASKHKLLLFFNGLFKTICSVLQIIYVVGCF